MPPISVTPTFLNMPLRTVLYRSVEEIYLYDFSSLSLCETYPKQTNLLYRHIALVEQFLKRIFFTSLSCVNYQSKKMKPYGHPCFRSVDTRFPEPALKLPQYEILTYMRNTFCVIMHYLNFSFLKKQVKMCLQFYLIRMNSTFLLAWYFDISYFYQELQNASQLSKVFFQLQSLH